MAQIGGNFTNNNSFQNSRGDGGNNKDRTNANTQNNPTNSRPKNFRPNGTMNQNFTTTPVPSNSRGGIRGGSSRGRGGHNKPFAGKRNDNNINTTDNPKDNNGPERQRSMNKGSKDQSHSNNNSQPNKIRHLKRSTPRASQAQVTPPPVINPSNLSTHTGIEIQFVGAFLQNPEKLGYTKILHPPQEKPKYMLKEQVEFNCQNFQPNAWDIQNQQVLLEREQQHKGDAQTLFEEFQELRKEERNKMEEFNLVDVENAKKSLSDAILFRGSCPDMCPTYERVERTFKNQVSKWERDPATGKISRNFAIKTFIRPSGQAPSLPSDVRSPPVLVKTMNYIVENLITKLPDSHSFIWDRTRSIRQDFTFQNNYSGPEAIECHEKICRIHILSSHIMAGANDPDYQQQQEIEQFNNSLQTLTHMYNDVRSRGGSCPNEAEFRAYELISKLKDTELDRTLQTLPLDIFQSAIVQRALMLRGLIVQNIGNINLYTEFFRTILDPNTPFLLACLSEIHFNEIRYNALKTMSRAYHSKSKKMPDVPSVARWLGFDSIESCLKTCQFYDIPVNYDEMNIPRVDICAIKSSYKSTQSPPYTIGIDVKISNQTMQGIINSGLPNGDLGLTVSKQINLEELAKESFREHASSRKAISEILDQSRPPTAVQNSTQPISTLSNTEYGSMPSAPTSNLFGSNSTAPVTSTTGSTFGKQPAFSFTSMQQPSSTTTGAFSGVSQPTKAPPQSFNFTPNIAQPQFQLNPALSQQQQQFALTKASFSPPLTSSEPRPFSFGQQQQQQPITTSNPAPSTDINPTFSSGSVSGVPKPAAVSESSSASASIPAATPEAIPQPKLVELPGFDSAITSLVNDLTKEIVSEEMAKIIKSSISKEQQKRQQKKDNMINQLAEELFEAFMKEQIYINALSSRANHFREKHLKSNAIKKVKVASGAAMSKSRGKKEKLAEIERFTNKVTPTFVPPTAAFKRKAIWFERSTIQDLAVSKDTTLDLKSLLRIDFGSNRLKMLFAVKDWSTIPAKWVIDKFNLHKSVDTKSKRLIFKNKISEHSKVLDVRSLPTRFKARHYLKNIDFLIFQIELTPKKGGVERLKSYVDGISTIIEGMNKYNNGRFTDLIVLLFNDTTTKLSDISICQTLKTSELEANNKWLKISVIQGITSSSDNQWNIQLQAKLLKHLSTVLKSAKPSLLPQPATASTIDETCSNGSSMVTMNSETSRFNNTPENSSVSMLKTDKRNLSRIKYIKSTLNKPSQHLQELRKRKYQNSITTTPNEGLTNGNTSLMSNYDGVGGVLTDYDVSLLSVIDGPLSGARFNFGSGYSNNNNSRNADSVFNDSTMNAAFTTANSTTMGNGDSNGEVKRLEKKRKIMELMKLTAGVLKK